jgi:hypothetical protein
MLQRLARLSRTVALPLTAAVLAAIGVAGCEGESSDGSEIAQDSVRNVHVDAGTLAKLGAGERLSIDLTTRGVMYHFSVAQELDFGRIDLSFAAGKVSMDSALASVFSSPYTPLGATNKQFVITADPADFPELTDVDIEALRKERMITLEHGSSAPKAQPQSVDNCIEQTIYFFVDVVIDGTVVSLPCSHTTVICDGTEVCSKETFGGHDYLFCEDAKSWTSAKSSCANFGYGLLTINDSIEENWAYHMAGNISHEKWWMGLNDRASEGRFVWDSGQPVTYSHWYWGEPNNSVGGNEYCAQLNRFYPDFGWNDEPCELHFRYVCESN